MPNRMLINFFEVVMHLFIGNFGKGDFLRCSSFDYFIDIGHGLKNFYCFLMK
jgi:hypothetical protein